ncbi:hypothetical protein FPE01S_01_07710 [Flavihumibacter petaseus NBRC 106054]|uniref:DUF2071 domain-containing protein n=2 Tax=Flavihumibacter TaxID=1004301 RepID=A0A0E9MVH1_9BACT|nr:hypothetical protein FPE01S_01_07710 [Flavihumibacter petaseus NBRC 106054]
MANYAVDKSLLNSYLPHRTELDLWNNTCYVSLVGFLFTNTKLKGFRIPFHTNFEEVNLRFYVRYNDSGTWKRGVVFVKEIVPKPALTLVANTVYKENYETMPMEHSWITANHTITAEYKWKKGRWHSIKVKADQVSVQIAAGSEEEFITEHYWGYTRITSTKTSEYQVEHPKWDVYPTKGYHIDVDFGNIYGEEFDFLKNENPKSVFLAEGSPIKVNAGKII